MKRYAIWNKRDAIITPVGEVLTAEAWVERYPVAGIPTITVVCAAGEINGAFFGTLGQMVQMYEAEGADFSECRTAEDKLEVIEAFEDAQAEASANTPVDTSAESLASIAAALEFQNLMMLPDDEEVE